MNKRFITGLVLVFAGMLAIMVGSLLSIFTNTSATEAGGGVAGCIVVFFIPICFGSGSVKYVPLLVIISILLFIVVLIFLYLIHKSIVNTFAKGL